MQITDYIKPELIVVALVLYFVGMWTKQSEAVKDRYIPLINGGLGIVICGIYVLATSTCRSGQEIFYGNIYRHNPGNSAGRAEHICQSNHKAGREGGIKYSIFVPNLF